MATRRGRCETADRTVRSPCVGRGLEKPGVPSTTVSVLLITAIAILVVVYRKPEVTELIR